MGGNKSKPMAGAAREVLARRTEAEIRSTTLSRPAHTVLTKQINIFYEPDVKETESHELDPDIVAEISKWPEVKRTGRPVQVLKHKPADEEGEGVPSAVLVRVREQNERRAREAEEKALTGKFQKIQRVTNRLSEEMLISMLKKFREDTTKTYTAEVAAQEFQIPVETVRIIIASARFPILYEDKDPSSKVLIAQ